jgi:hypothetical protein
LIDVVTVLVLLPGTGSFVPAGGATVAVFDKGAFVAGEVVPLIVMTSEPPDGKVGIVPLTMLPVTETTPGQTAPPVALPQVALAPVSDAGSGSLNVAPFAADGPALVIVSV